MEREGRKLLALGAIATLSLVLALAHSGPGKHGMSGEEMGATISICLAVVEGGAALLLLALGSARLARRWRSCLAPARPPRWVLVPRSPGPCLPRAGPDLLQVFLS